ncbi:MAG: RHS repeat-associated core domain-containing protein [Candidatus Omnitrophota bacterium]
MEKGGQSYYYHSDGLGSVTNLTDSTGATAESYSYDVFGKPSTTSAIGNRYMFTGREYDAETGLYHYRERSYSPQIGRFLQRDPLQIDDENTYSYCSNDPINYIDPHGLQMVSIGTSEGPVWTPPPGLGPTWAPPPGITIPPGGLPGSGILYNTAGGALGAGALTGAATVGGFAVSNPKITLHGSQDSDSGVSKMGIVQRVRDWWNNLWNKNNQKKPPGKNVWWDEKRKRWVDDEYVYTWDKKPHKKRGGGSHWDRGPLKGGKGEWSPDGASWYPK